MDTTSSTGSRRVDYAALGVGDAATRPRGLHNDCRRAVDGVRKGRDTVHEVVTPTDTRRRSEHANRTDVHKWRPLSTPGEALSTLSRPERPFGARSRAFSAQGALARSAGEAGQSPAYSISRRAPISRRKSSFSAISRSIFSQPGSTVEWSRPPSASPMRRSGASVSSRMRYMAI
jgi:hypothetical protein